MANTTFYREAENGISKILWKDLFSESFKKHSEKERIYALNVGTPLNRTTPARMLSTWHKPWLWFPAAKAGVGFVLFLYGLLLFCQYALGAVTNSLFTMVIILPPVIMPLVVLLFIWELNIPQNISILELGQYFLAGGALSFAVNSAMFLFVPNGPAWLAPLREEPAKLVAAVVLLLFAEKVQRKTLYGITGLVIGAAVGTGFSAFESVTYALTQNSIQAVLQVQILRGVLAVGGHMVFCAPYMAALVLKTRSVSAKSFLQPEFWVAYLVANLIHGAWNASDSLLFLVVLIVGMWLILFRWVHVCLMQLLEVGRAAEREAGAADGNRHARGELTVVCTQGDLRGAAWCSTGQTLTMGRAESCAIRLPATAKGISRLHCRLEKTGTGWALRDLDSSCGTWLAGRRLPPGYTAVLKDGDSFCLGSSDAAFTVRIQ